MTDEQWDVVVIGGGPAGSSAAYHLASAGMRTLLIDRERFPRTKVCGDALSPRAVEFLRTIGVEVPVATLRIEGVRIRTSRETRIVSYTRNSAKPSLGTVIPRAALDLRIRDTAKRAGAVVREGCAAVALEMTSDGAEAKSYLGDGPSSGVCDEARVW